MNKEPEEPAFRVTDKRLFREDGQLRERAAAEPEKKSDPSSFTRSAQPSAQPPPGTAPAIDFASYVLSYYTQGLVFLGEAPNPFTNQKEQDLESARHMVDILGMLQEKTKGNLSKEEDQLLDSALYELRMKFMSKANRIKL
jgi:hypothetical protein